MMNLYLAMEVYFGVDVGTGSVRSAAFDRSGNLVGKPAICDIATHAPRPNFYQQSSRDIWEAVCTTVRQVAASFGPENEWIVGGIGFDATCSLVLIGRDGNGISVDPDSDESEWDVILWMVHSQGLPPTQKINCFETYRFATRHSEPRKRPTI